MSATFKTEEARKREQARLAAIKKEDRARISQNIRDTGSRFNPKKKKTDDKPSISTPPKKTGAKMRTAAEIAAEKQADLERRIAEGKAADIESRRGISDDPGMAGTPAPAATDTLDEKGITDIVYKLLEGRGSTGEKLTDEQKDYIAASKREEEMAGAAGAKGLGGFGQSIEGFTGGTGGTESNLPISTQGIIQEMRGVNQGAFNTKTAMAADLYQKGQSTRAGQVSRRLPFLSLSDEGDIAGLSSAEQGRVEAPFLTKIQRTEERRKEATRKLDEKEFEMERKMNRAITERERFNVGQDIKLQKMAGILGTAYDSNAMKGVMESSERGQVALDDLRSDQAFQEKQFGEIGQAIARDYELSVDEIENKMANSITERYQTLIGEIEDIEEKDIKDAKELSDTYMKAFDDYKNGYIDELKFTNTEIVRANKRIDDFNRIRNKITKTFTDNNGVVIGINERGEEIWNSGRAIAKFKKSGGSGGSISGIKLSNTQKNDLRQLGYTEEEIAEPKVEMLNELDLGTRTIQSALGEGATAQQIGATIGKFGGAPSETITLPDVVLKQAVKSVQEMINTTDITESQARSELSNAGYTKAEINATMNKVIFE